MTSRLNGVTLLAAERDELGINAGMMDRVVRTYEGCFYMDLDRNLMQAQQHGHYERIDVARLPRLFLAYKKELSKVSGIVLNDIKVRYDQGDPFVVGTLARIAGLAEQGREALLNGDHGTFARLMDENFDLRSQIMRISASNMEMINVARRCGASAKFAGSGGSIVECFDGPEVLQALRDKLGKIGATVVVPDLD